MVARFVNAVDDAARLASLSRFSIPVGGSPAPRQRVASIQAMQSELEGLLKALNDKDYRAVAVHAGARLQYCAHCGNG